MVFDVAPAVPGDAICDSVISELARRLNGKVQRTTNTSSNMVLSENASNIASLDSAGGLLVKEPAVIELATQTVTKPDAEIVYESQIPDNIVTITVSGKDFTAGVPSLTVTPIAHYESVSSPEVVTSDTVKVRIVGQKGTVFVKPRIIDPATGIIDDTIAVQSVPLPEAVKVKVGEKIPAKVVTLTIGNAAEDAAAYFWGTSWATPAENFSGLTFEIINAQKVAFVFHDLIGAVELHPIGYRPTTADTAAA